MCADRGLLGLKGCPKAGNTSATPSLYLRFHVRVCGFKIEHELNLERENFPTYFYTVRNHVKYTKHLQQSKIFSYTVYENHGQAELELG